MNIQIQMINFLNGDKNFDTFLIKKNQNFWRNNRQNPPNPHLPINNVFKFYLFSSLKLKGYLTI